MLAAKNKERKVCFLIFFYGYEMRKVKRKKNKKKRKNEWKNREIKKKIGEERKKKKGE